MVRSSRPTLTTLNEILNSRRITWRTMSLVHNVPGPQRELEGELGRVRADDPLVQPGDLPPGQLRWPTRHRLRDQRVPATFPELRQPPVHRLAVQPQCGSDILRMSAGLDLLDRP